MAGPTCKFAIAKLCNPPDLLLALEAIQRIEVTSSVEDAVAGADGLKANVHVPAHPFGTQFIAVCGAQADGEQRAEENGIGEVGAAPASAAAVQCIHLG